MASTFSTRLRLEKMGTGEKDDTWGTTLNTAVIDMIDEAMDGYLEKSVAGSSNVTLTTNSGAADETRQRVLKLTGTLTGNIEVSCAAVEKEYFVWNETDGSFSLTFKPAGGTGIAIPQGFGGRVFTDGTTMYRAGPWINPDGGKLQLDENGSGRNGVPRLSQVQDSQPTWLGTTGGTAQAQTASATPSLVNAGITTGASFDFIAGFTTTATDPTLNIDAFGAITMKGEDGSALPDGAIQANRMYRVTKGASTFYVRGIRSKIGTAQATTSGTAKDFTVATEAQEIVIEFNEVSLSGTDNVLVQIGTGGVATTSGYASTIAILANGASVATGNSTAGFAIGIGTASGTLSGHMLLTHNGNNTWVESHSAKIGTATVTTGGGVVTLAGTINFVRVTSTGTDTFDAGSVNVLVRGVE